VDAKALSTFMGHANTSITLDRYGHLMPGFEEEAAGLLDAYLEAKREGCRGARSRDRSRIGIGHRQFCKPITFLRHYQAFLRLYPRSVVGASKWVRGSRRMA
jgi:hypothetical protein